MPDLVTRGIPKHVTYFVFFTYKMNFLLFLLPILCLLILLPFVFFLPSSSSPHSFSLLCFSPFFLLSLLSPLSPPIFFLPFLPHPPPFFSFSVPFPHSTTSSHCPSLPTHLFLLLPSSPSPLFNPFLSTSSSLRILHSLWDID